MINIVCKTLLKFQHTLKAFDFELPIVIISKVLDFPPFSFPLNLKNNNNKQNCVSLTSVMLFIN